MWMSNTATTALMTPLAKAVCIELHRTNPYITTTASGNNTDNFHSTVKVEKEVEEDSDQMSLSTVYKEKLSSVSIAIDLGIAFASSIGRVLYTYHDSMSVWMSVFI